MDVEVLDGEKDAGGACSKEHILDSSSSSSDSGPGSISGSDSGSNPGSNPSSSSSSSSSEEEGRKLAPTSLWKGFLVNMFSTLAPTLKKVLLVSKEQSEWCKQSSSCSRSRDADGSKCHHVPSLDSQQDLDKPDKKKKCSDLDDTEETPS